MSVDPAPRTPANKIRWIITGCLVVLAVYGIVWMAFNRPSEGGGEAGLTIALNMMGLFMVLDVLAVIGLGVWILRPPVPNAVSFLGRWTGKILLFLGLSLATVIFFFVCHLLWHSGCRRWDSMAATLVFPRLQPLLPSRSRSMSNDPKPHSVLSTLRWVITGCLGVAAAYCVFSIASDKSSKGWGEGLSALGSFAIIDVLAFVRHSGHVVLRPSPDQVLVASGRYWVEKIVLTLGLALAAVIFLFVTCLSVL